MSQPERAKHDTWLNLGKMESFEAMRLFVKLMDEERPRWWEVSPGGSGRTPTRRPSNPEPKIPELPSALAASTQNGSPSSAKKAARATAVTTAKARTAPSRSVSSSRQARHGQTRDGLSPHCSLSALQCAPNEDGWLP